MTTISGMTLVKRIVSWAVAAAIYFASPARGFSAERLEPLVNETVEAKELARVYPPVVRNEKKKIVFEIALPAGAVHAGKVNVSRWKAPALPAEFPKDATKATSVPGFYTYDAPAKGVTAWHVNFADPDLFAFYGSGLLAQDELQVAEHPMLASVREFLLAKKLPALTVEKTPTPILVMGVERRVKINTAPTAENPGGLYGNRFAAADAATIRKAVSVIDPPTISNILAMAAPRPGSGAYTRETLEHILTTAYTGFRAANEKSPADSKVEIHTGFWGCGAFGGNRTVMVALQIAAARLAGVEIVFHTADKAGEKDFSDGAAAFEKAADGATVDELLKRIEAAKYQWGVSDGN